MHQTGPAHERGLSGPAQLHRLRELLQRGDADTFARELDLDSQQTARWFESGFGPDGYGSEVVKALGVLVLQRMLLSAPQRKDDARG